MGEIKKNKKSKRSISLLIILFIMFELIFTVITAPFMLYYGPFKNVRNLAVGSAMTTLKSQWLAELFLSDDKIKQIMKDQTVKTIVQTDLEGVTVKSENDNSIERYNIQSKNYKGYVLIISDPTRIKVGYSNMLNKEGEPTSDIARDNNAIAAVNGGAFTDGVVGSKYTGTGGSPIGIIMSNGKILSDTIKNETIKTEVVALTKAGKLLVGPHSIKEMKNIGVTEALSFGPALIVNGQKTITKGNGNWGIAGRTAIAQRKDGAIILLVIDGRQLGSLGVTLREVQDILFDEYGAYNASNLDGGSSATMFYDDEVINSPSDPLGERSIPSIIYVKSRK